jgi:hypothetical protein
MQGSQQGVKRIVVDDSIDKNDRCPEIPKMLSYLLIIHDFHTVQYMMAMGSIFTSRSVWEKLMLARS